MHSGAGRSLLPLMEVMWLDNRTFRYRRIYAVMWRIYYAVIMVACGLIIAYFTGRSGDILFAAGVLVLTGAAVAALFLWTFRHRHTRRVLEIQKPR